MRGPDLSFGDVRVKRLAFGILAGPLHDVLNILLGSLDFELPGLTLVAVSSFRVRTSNSLPIFNL